MCSLLPPSGKHKAREGWATLGARGQESGRGKRGGSARARGWPNRLKKRGEGERECRANGREKKGERILGLREIVREL